jgi:type 1 fimbriae regulatory protein FimB/type 1 fimbriae regulatory protein FimE
MSNVIDLARRREPSPTANFGKVSPPRRRPNADSRPREYLTEQEVERLRKAARKSGRYSQRDETLVMVMAAHGLRVSEAVALRWDAVELDSGRLHVSRRKNGTPSTHTLCGPEIRALRQLRRDWPDSPFVFCSERGGPMTDSNVRKLISRLGTVAKLSFPIHPHMLRHAAGYRLVNQDNANLRAVQLWLGHKNIMHTVRYTELSEQAFKGFEPAFKT